MAANYANLSDTFQGRGLNTEQRLGLKNAIAKVVVQEGGYDEISFWGKVLGEERDYFIVKGVKSHPSKRGHEGHVHKSFLYSEDGGLSLSYLPKTDDFVATVASNLRSNFTGNSAFKYNAPTGESNSSPLSVEEKEKEEKFESKKSTSLPSKVTRTFINELERLAFTVRHIDSLTCLVPLGSYFRNAGGSLSKDEEFNGLPLNTNVTTKAFQLYRTPVQQTTQATLRKNVSSNTYECFDTLTDAQNWLIHQPQSSLKVTVRNVVVPGYELHLTLGSPEYTSAYYGYGLLNPDVAFML